MTLNYIQTYLLKIVLYYGVFTCGNGQYDDYVEVGPRIVGGRPAMEGEAFYQLALSHKEKVVCGAVLALSPKSFEQIVLTAAHCVLNTSNNRPLAPQIMSLRGDTLNKEIAGQTRNAVKVVPHEAYRFENLFSDIAIIFLGEPFDVTPTIQPVSLPVDEWDDQTDFLIVSGWGKLQEYGGLYPARLQIVTLPVISNKVCRKWHDAFGSGQYILPTNICAGLEYGAMDFCHGDSGEPAVGQNSRGLFLAGIASWGIGCAGVRSPGVYTRMSMFVDWIAENTL